MMTLNTIDQNPGTNRIRSALVDKNSSRGSCSWFERPMGGNWVGDTLIIVDKRFQSFTWNGSEWVDPEASSNGSLLVPAMSGGGILVDMDDPTFCWRDILGEINPKTTGIGSPTRAVYNGGVQASMFFVANDLCDFVWHIPHDYVPGTDLLWHVHWSHTGTTITGNAVFDLFYTTGKRDGSFTTEKNLTITVPTVDLATTPRLKHFVSETAMTAAASTAILIPNSAIEVDGIINGTMRMTTLPTLGGSGKLFIHTSDIHYQSSNIGTKLSAFPYYG